MAVALATFGAASAQAQTVTLAWDPSPGSVAGYLVSYGTVSHQYTASVDVGNQTSFQFSEPDPTAIYYFAIRAYDATGNQSTFSDEVSTAPPPSPLALTSVSADRPAPQQVGASVTFSAAASGGTAPYQYKWLVFDGLTWSTTQSWSTSNQFSWAPAAANANYQVGVWVRSATSTADAADSSASTGSMPFAIVQPLTLLNMTVDSTPPKPAGWTITFTVTATGGAAPYQFKWLVSDGSTSTVGQNWSAGSSFAWTPTAANSNYSITAWARNASSVADAPDNSGAVIDMPFAISPAAALAPLGVSLSIGLAKGNGLQFTATIQSGSSRVAGAVVVFTVTDPAGKVSTFTATSSTSGVATVKMPLNSRSPKGTYQVKAVATSAGATGTATGNYIY